MSPERLNLLLFLKANRSYWNVQVVGEAMNRVTRAEALAAKGNAAVPIHVDSDDDNEEEEEEEEDEEGDEVGDVM